MDVVWSLTKGHPGWSLIGAFCLLVCSGLLISEKEVCASCGATDSGEGPVEVEETAAAIGLNLLAFTLLGRRTGPLVRFQRICLRCKRAWAGRIIVPGCLSRLVGLALLGLSLTAGFSSCSSLLQ